ncbi:MerR family transcriptional regulator [Paracoccus siganidrum]|uniref:MerR family transcriptional regulator n=1 Tax=Paracoccus siganidrum TaxID=1276757 RepID=A0A419A5B3_9RHOB|nr:helix-turn-helix domain-containing protein [Paracoccus siganidrum]RJL11099.1 MerR family transcriptional regulator [Paracoccus siganidrum]RMC29889.1 MerR family transcriptional regulator [Paracoccus siganidrum]
MQHETVKAGRLSIGELAERTGCSVPTIRFYEEIGLVPKAARTGGGRRIYAESDAKLLTFIRRCRDFGFPVEQVRDLVALSTSRDRNCFEARDLAGSHLASLRQKIAEMRKLERSLEEFVARCEIECAGGPAAECVILGDLGDAGQECGAGEACS